MNEIEEMREAFERAETNLRRFRWIICNPREAIWALQDYLMNQGGKAHDAAAVVREIDDARK